MVDNGNGRTSLMKEYGRVRDYQLIVSTHTRPLAALVQRGSSGL